MHTGRVLDSVSALDWVGVRRRTDVRATLKALLVHRHDDLAPFDQAFDLFWRVHNETTGGLPLFSLGERARVSSTQAPAVPLRWRTNPRARFDQCDSARRRGLQPRARESDEGLCRLYSCGTAGGRSGAGGAWMGAWRAPYAPLVRRVVGLVDLRRIVGRNMRHGGELVTVPLRRRRSRRVRSSCSPT